MIGRRPPPPPEEPVEPRGFDEFELRLGDVMRGERATLGKSLLDVQRDLKIRATYIAAIENADATAFETPGFVAGYVRSYARYLGLDPEWAYRTFCEESDFVSVHGVTLETNRSPKPQREIVLPREGRDPFAEPGAPFAPKTEALLSNVQPGALGSIFVLLLLIGGIGYGGFSVLQEIQRVQFAPVEQAPGVLSDLDPLAGATVAAVTETGAATPPTSPDVLDRLYRPQALDVPVMTARDGPIATLDPGTVGTLAPKPDMADAVALALEEAVQDPETPAEPEIQVVEADPDEVIMVAVRPAWVRVRAADGTVIFEKIMEAGERFTIPPTEEPPTLRAGNSGSVYFEMAGNHYGPAGRAGSVVKNIALSVDALTEAYAVADLEADQDLAVFVAEARAAE